jgi:SPOR domain
MSGCSEPVRNDGHMFERWADQVAAIPIDDGSHPAPAHADNKAQPRAQMKIDLIDASHMDSQKLGLRSAVALVDSELAGLRRKIAPDATPETNAAPAASDEQVSAAPTFMAQLAAYPTRKAAEGAWSRLKAAHPEALGALQARFEPVDLGGRGVWTRLQAGPLATREKASAVCAEAGVTDRWCVSPSRG